MNTVKFSFSDETLGMMTSGQNSMAEAVTAACMEGAAAGLTVRQFKVEFRLAGRMSAPNCVLEKGLACAKAHSEEDTLTAVLAAYVANREAVAKAAAKAAERRAVKAATAPTASAPTASAPTASAPTASAPTASAPTASAPTASAPTAPAATAFEAVLAAIPLLSGEELAQVAGLVNTALRAARHAKVA